MVVGSCLRMSSFFMFGVGCNFENSSRNERGSESFVDCSWDLESSGVVEGSSSDSLFPDGAWVVGTSVVYDVGNGVE